MNGQSQSDANSGVITHACVLCGDSATGENRSKEHIIPQSVGGGSSVIGFTCRRCNNGIGLTYDAALAKSFERLILLLDISRQKPLPRGRVAQMSDGLRVRVLPGNRVELAENAPQAFSEEGRSGLHLVASTRAELRQMIQKISDRRGLDLDVEAHVEQATERTIYLDEPIDHGTHGWGPDEYRSLVKSALALVFHAEVDPRCAEIGLAYMAGDDETKCIFPYYNKDLLSQRELGMPINCVYVKGDPDTREVMAYVEILGILRCVIRLSENYEGEHFEHSYAIDPTDGAELEVVVDLDSSLLAEAEQELDYFGGQTGGLQGAIELVISRALDLANRKHLATVILAAINEYCTEMGIAPDQPWTDAEYRAMWDYIGESVMPFFDHLRRPMKLPEEILDGFSQGS